MSRLINNFVIAFAVACAGMVVSADSAQAAEYNDAELQALFTSKKQRSRIDAVRAGRGVGSQGKKSTSVKVSGYMTRSDGKSVVWVNDGNTIDGSRVNGLKVHSGSVGKNNRVTISVDGKRKHLKPGETWRKDTGKVSDSY